MYVYEACEIVVRAASSHTAREDTEVFSVFSGQLYFDSTRLRLCYLKAGHPRIRGAQRRRVPSNTTPDYTEPKPPTRWGPVHPRGRVKLRETKRSYVRG